MNQILFHKRFDDLTRDDVVKFFNDKLFPLLQELEIYEARATFRL